MSLEDKGREWMMIIVCEEKETNFVIKKKKKFDILIKFSVK